MSFQIQERRDLAANWTSVNPILAEGERAYELDTGNEKRGDGITAWNALPYLGAGAGTVTNIATAGLISGGPITTTGTITTSMATNRLVGRGTAGTGIMEEITLGTGLSLSGTTLNASGGIYNIVPVSTTPYTVVPTTGYTIYLVDASGGNIVMNFPTAVGNTATYGVKKIDSSANTIILTPDGAETIDGSATKTILYQNTEVEVFSDNSNLYLK